MIAEIVIYACLVMAPTNCSSYTLQAQEISASPSAGYIEAQAIVAKWIEARPSLTLKRFRLLPGQGA